MSHREKRSLQCLQRKIVINNKSGLSSISKRDSASPGCSLLLLPEKKQNADKRTKNYGRILLGYLRKYTALGRAERLAVEIRGELSDWEGPRGGPVCLKNRLATQLQPQLQHWSESQTAVESAPERVLDVIGNKLKPQIRAGATEELSGPKGEELSRARQLLLRQQH